MEISVDDTGIGIDEEERDKLFQMFTQGDISYTKIYQGMGLGLVISKKMVEAMNGEIGYKSEKGKGSRFYFRLKLNL
jgi:signal transduction histidine kinase